MVSASLPAIRAVCPPGSDEFRKSRLLSAVYDPIDRLANTSSSLLARKEQIRTTTGETADLPRYLFLGPKGGDEPLRIGIFAGIHGDEPEGVHALINFLAQLDAEPQLATGFCLFCYPVCNPTGFEDRTRFSRSGKDLNREFWKGSEEPEVKLLQSELIMHAFHGIISLHTDESSHGFYGFAHGDVISRQLIEPALDAAELFLPRNEGDLIDGFAAANGVVRDSYPGILNAPPGVKPRPFEIILETPQQAPNYLKEAALVAALRTILTRYRAMMAYAANI